MPAYCYRSTVRGEGALRQCRTQRPFRHAFNLNRRIHRRHGSPRKAPPGESPAGPSGGTTEHARTMQNASKVRDMMKTVVTPACGNRTKMQNLDVQGAANCVCATLGNAPRSLITAGVRKTLCMTWQCEAQRDSKHQSKTAKHNRDASKGWRRRTAMQVTVCFPIQRDCSSRHAASAIPK